MEVVHLTTNVVTENNKNSLSCGSAGQKSKQVGRTMCFSGGSRAECISSPFGARRGCQHSLVCDQGRVAHPSEPVLMGKHSRDQRKDPEMPCDTRGFTGT